MAPAINIILGIMAGLCMITAIYFIISGLQARQRFAQNAYDVQRQEARFAMLVAFARAALFILITLILAAVIGINLVPPGEDATATPTLFPTAESTAPSTSEPLVVATETVVKESPTSPIPSPTAIPTDTPLPTDTPVVLMAIVNSPNGLWLREAPGGTQELELIPDGSFLILLTGRETVEDLEWQEVESEAGNRGWVALDFIIIQ